MDENDPSQWFQTLNSILQNCSIIARVQIKIIIHTKEAQLKAEMQPHFLHAVNNLWLKKISKQYLVQNQKLPL